MTRPLRGWARKRRPRDMPAHVALALLIAYALEGTALKRDATRQQRRVARRRACS